MIVDLAREVNEHFQPLLYSRARHLVLKGGAGSGKSHFVAQKILARAACEKRHRFIVIRKTTPAVRDSAWQLLKSYAHRWQLPVHYNDNTMRMSVDGVSEIYCRGLDKAEKIKSIEGVTGFWLEEPTELKKEDFIQIDLRLRGKPQNYFQIIQSFNPVSKLHWIYDEFFARERDDARVDHSTYRDNAFLDDEYIRVLENLINEDETYYNIYTLGEWGEVRAIIYNNWVREQFEPFDKLKYEILTGGLDFGYNNPAALVLAGVRDNEIYYFAEVYKTHLTNTELIDLVADKFTELGLQTWDVPLWADHEMDRIEEFQKAGFTIFPAEKVVPVKNQIDFLKRMREHVSEDCPNLIREQQGYKWKEDLRTGLTLDEPVKFRDHAMDAKRYAVYSLYFTLTGEKRKPELVLGGKSFVKGLGEWQSDQRTRPQD